MKKRKAFIKIVSTALLLIQQAFAGNTYLGLDLGRSNIKINETYSVEGDQNNKIDLSTISFKTGYLFSNNMITELSIRNTASDNLFGIVESYKINSHSTAIGYRFQLNNSVHITPKVGIHFWELKTKEGKLFNPGKEEKKTFNGEDFFALLTLDTAISKRISFYIDIGIDDYRFGRNTFTDLGLKLKLGQ